jgi:hypothetical protein
MTCSLYSLSLIFIHGLYKFNERFKFARQVYLLFIVLALFEIMRIILI